MKIIDASLAAKLVLAEVDSDSVDAWFSSMEHVLGAPDLIALEVAQAIVRQVNAGEIGDADGRAALRQWHIILDEGAIELFRMTPPRVAAATELALTLAHPTADCLYLALAVETGSDLVTADAKFVARASGAFPCVRLLAETE